jgi:hypothetical protein
MKELFKLDIKFKCHWHDFDCDRSRECFDCEHCPKDEDKPNYHKPRRLAYVDPYGMPECPACHEATYDNKRCFFCGQPFKLKKKYLRKPLIVGWKQYKGVFVEGGSWVYKDGKFILHAQTSKRLTPKQARKQLKMMPKLLSVIGRTDE